MEHQGSGEGTKNLKDVGLKATVPRLKVLEVLQNAQDEHLSVEAIYQRMLNEGKNVGLATVYRVLTQFEKAGLVIRHNFDGGYSVFELSSNDHHDHLQCINCGRIVEFYKEELEQLKDNIADDMGFILRDHSLILYGACKKKNCPHRMLPSNT